MLRAEHLHPFHRLLLSQSCLLNPFELDRQESIFEMSRKSLLTVCYFEYTLPQVELKLPLLLFSVDLLLFKVFFQVKTNKQMKWSNFLYYFLMVSVCSCYLAQIASEGLSHLLLHTFPLLPDPHFFLISPCDILDKCHFSLELLIFEIHPVAPELSRIQQKEFRGINCSSKSAAPPPSLDLPHSAVSSAPPPPPFSRSSVCIYLYLAVFIKQ